MKKIVQQPRLILLGVTLAYSLFFIGLLLFGSHKSHLVQALVGLCRLPLPLFAAVISIAASQFAQGYSRLERSGWFLIGLAALLWAVGQGISLSVQSQAAHQRGAGIGDFVCLIFYPIIIVGVFLLIAAVRGVLSVRLLLDSAIVASNFGIVIWYFVINPLWDGASVPVEEKLLTVCHPIGDALLMFCALTLNAASQRSVKPRATQLLVAGLSLMAFADGFVTFLSLEKGYRGGALWDSLFPFGAMIVGLSAYLYETIKPDTEGDTLKRERKEKGIVTIIRLFAPYLLVFTTLGLIALHDYLVDYILNESTLLCCGLVIALVIARQGFMLLENQRIFQENSRMLDENQRLTHELRTFNENLEQSVARRTRELGHRTRQLSALHQLTKAINTTLKSNEVVDLAAQHIQTALQSHAVVIWLWEPGAPFRDAATGVAARHGIPHHPQLLTFLRQMPSDGQVFAQRIPKNVMPTEIAALLARKGLDEKLAVSACLRMLLSWQGQSIGMISVIRWRGGFEPADAALLESIGLEVATALENARQYFEAVQAADSDALTGLFNHRAIHERLEQEIARAQRDNGAFALMMMDLDNFKLFNDTYGHPVGDQALNRVGRTLAAVCGEKALIGRYGGDEFIAILPDLNAEQAANIAQQIRERLANADMEKFGKSARIPMPLSFGIAVYPHDSTHRDELLMQADANLYAAKDSETGIALSSERQQTNLRMSEDNSVRTLAELVTTVDNKDRYTRRHSDDVTEYALWIAEEMGLSRETQRIIRIGGLLHDVGKIGIPENILKKPGKLTDDEYEALKQHPVVGALIVGGVPELEGIMDAVRYHHERWDGKGYPEGLSGQGIPLIARILGVADAVSAMTTNRSYRKKMTWAAVAKEVETNAGTQFDPAIASLFLDAMKKRLTPEELAPDIPLAKAA